MGAYSEEQGKRFHRDILDFKSRYQGHYNERKVGDYICGLFHKSDYSIVINLENHTFLIDWLNDCSCLSIKYRCV